MKSFRILLLPFALIYWLAIAIRNCCFDKNIFKSSGFGLPLICVGNLSVGGTGKTPMVEHLVMLLKNKYQVATLSRGYKRKTKGYALADEESTALYIGDEPMQFHLKFPDVSVAVGEDRIDALSQLLQDKPNTELVILDDAFQHRAVKAGMNILLTDYSNLFTRDFYLPTGDLRDLKKEYKRAQIIVVTKCPYNITEEEKLLIIEEIKPLSHQTVFFASFQYGIIHHIANRGTLAMLDPETEVLLVTGIANPKPLKSFLENFVAGYSFLQYPDHYIFSIDDIKEINKKVNELSGKKKLIITTEKDAVRLFKFEKEIASMPLFVIPVQHHFLFNEQEKFANLIEAYLQQSPNGAKK